MTLPAWKSSTRGVAAVLVTLVVVSAAAVMVQRSIAGRGPRHGSRATEATSGPRLVTVEVGGMVCAGCVAKIQSQLASLPGVLRVEVSLADQRAQVLCERSLADTSLTAAVRRAGPEYVGMVLN